MSVVVLRSSFKSRYITKRTTHTSQQMYTLVFKEEVSEDQHYHFAKDTCLVHVFTLLSSRRDIGAIYLAQSG